MVATAEGAHFDAHPTCFAIVLRNMYVRRFGAFIGVEMKAKSKQAKDRWHGSIMASGRSERAAVNRTLLASVNETPCFARLLASFTESHSNLITYPRFFGSREARILMRTLLAG